MSAGSGASKSSAIRSLPCSLAGLRTGRSAAIGTSFAAGFPALAMMISSPPRRRVDQLRKLGFGVVDVDRLHERSGYTRQYSHPGQTGQGGGQAPLPSFECAFGHAVPGVSTSRRPVQRYQEETSGARCCRQLDAIAGALLKTHSRGDLKTKLGQFPQRTPSAYIDSRRWLVRYAVAFSQLFRMSLAQAPPRFT